MFTHAATRSCLTASSAPPADSGGDTNDGGALERHQRELGAARRDAESCGQDQMLVNLNKMTAAVTPIATTTPLLVSGRVLEQQKSKTSSSSLFSAIQVVGARALHADSVFASAMPTRCSTKGPGHCTDSDHALPVFPSGDTTPLHDRASPGAGNCMLQGVGLAGMNTPTGCSTHVRTWLQDVPGARARNVDVSVNRGSPCQVQEHSTVRRPLRSPTSFPRFDGMNPRLWRTLCLEYFTHFNINKCMWVLAASMHMDGKAKEWYEAYRLRQPVGNWSEFMDVVEANFGVCDFHQELKFQLLPSETPVVGVARLGFDGIPSKSGSMEGETGDVHKLFDNMSISDSEPQTDNKPQDMYEQASLGDATQLPQQISDDSEEVLTQVWGVSLFLEQGVNSTNVFEDISSMKRVCEECIANPVLSYVGGLSLSLEKSLGSTDEMFQDVSTCHENTLSSSMVDVSAEGMVFALLPPWRCGDFNQGITNAKSEYLLHCSSRNHLSVHWDLDEPQHIYYVAPQIAR
ncbi:hypothetical protein ACQ4PT_048802 [Festuca glaucescens]